MTRFTDLEMLSLERLVDQYGADTVHKTIATIARGAYSRTARNLHLNWSACSGWDRVRSQLQFLRTTLYGNFADLRGELDTVTRQLQDAGFRVDVGPHFHGELCLRLYDN